MTDATDLRRFTGVLTTALALAVLASCGSSGRYPDTGGLDPGQDLARFSDQWVLDWDASDDPDRSLEAHGAKLQIERRTDGGGTVVDLVEASSEGNRLVVIRTVKGVPGSIPEIKLVFDPVEVSGDVTGVKPRFSLRWSERPWKVE